MVWTLLIGFAEPIEDIEALEVPTLILFEVFKRVLKQRDESTALQAVAVMQQVTVVDLEATIALNASRINPNRPPGTAALVVGQLPPPRLVGQAVAWVTPVGVMASREGRIGQLTLVERTGSDSVSSAERSNRFDAWSMSKPSTLPAASRSTFSPSETSRVSAPGPALNST